MKANGECGRSSGRVALDKHLRVGSAAERVQAAIGARADLDLIRVNGPALRQRGTLV